MNRFWFEARVRQGGKRAWAPDEMDRAQNRSFILACALSSKAARSANLQGSKFRNRWRFSLVAKPGLVVWHDGAMQAKRFKIRFLLVTLGLLATACQAGSDDKKKPSGTPNDPVMECEKHGQVCRIDGARLGVCVTPPKEKRQALCGDRFPCMQCAPQH